MKKRILSLLLALLMLFAVFPVGVLAAQSETWSFAEVNPLYADVISEDELPRPSSVGRLKAEPEREYKTALAELGADMRQAMVSRNKVITLAYRSYKNLDVNELYSELKQEAFRHTGKSFEGDYLRWSYGGLSGDIKKTYDSGVYYYVFDLRALYYTTAAQEKALSQRIDELFDAFALGEDASDFTVIKTVYDHICANVSYDEAHDDDYDLKYTAYAALVNGTAVCQGYAALVYAMLLHEGVDARIIAGADHGWNIARIGKLYYNLDTTWDSGLAPEEYRWFLKCPASFTEHPRDAEYKTAAFNEEYPMAENDYLYHKWDSGVMNKEPTCTEPGLMLYTCTDPGCGETMTITIPALKHSFTEWETVREPDCTQTGEQTRSCSRCGETETQSMAKLPHHYVDGYCTECGIKQTAGFFAGFMDFFRSLFSWIRSLFIFSPA